MKNALRLCYSCKFWKAGIGKQQMAPLPVHRVTPAPPFTACGTDLMGPVLVRIGRSEVKRYVCIFHCLATRAVHFEVLQSLEATAFIQAFRCFCNRRNARVCHVYSDNGGNFTLANKELNEGIQIWSSKQFQDATLQRNIGISALQWHRTKTV